MRIVKRHYQTVPAILTFKQLIGRQYAQYVDQARRLRRARERQQRMARHQQIEEFIITFCDVELMVPFLEKCCVENCNFVKLALCMKNMEMACLMEEHGHGTVPDSITAANADFWHILDNEYRTFARKDPFK